MISKFLVRIISKNLPETNRHVLERIDFLQNPYLRKIKISGMNFCIDKQSFEKERIGNVRPVSPEIAYNAIVGFCQKSIITSYVQVIIIE